MQTDPEPLNAWMVRAGDKNELITIAERDGAIAVGWAEMDDMSRLITREDFKLRYQHAYPEHSAVRVNVNAGQLYRFAREILQGDYLLTYDKTTRELLVGRVTSPYEYRPTVFTSYYPHIRRVHWLKRIVRDSFSDDARNTLGSSLTVFNLKAYVPEIHRLVVDGISIPEQPAESPEVQFHDEVKARADELIADLISKLDPFDFQDLVAGVLKAMGFRATSSPPGRDRGIDIIAHPDALGFGKPRIKVQVKHRTSAASGPDIRNFLATLANDENGLFVSTGGYTSDAKIEAERARVTVTLLDRDGFVDLLIEHYEQLDTEFKAQIPLRKVWVPVIE